MPCVLFCLFMKIYMVYHFARFIYFCCCSPLSICDSFTESLRSKTSWMLIIQPFSLLLRDRVLSYTFWDKISSKLIRKISRTHSKTSQKLFSRHIISESNFIEFSRSIFRFSSLILMKFLFFDFSDFPIFSIFGCFRVV